MPPSVTFDHLRHHAVRRSLALTSSTSSAHHDATSSSISRISSMARSYEYLDSRGRRMLFSSIPSVNSTIPDFYVQPALTHAVQPIHADDASISISKLPVTATSSNAVGTCAVHTMFSYSTLSCHSVTTFHLTCIHRPSLTTSSKHSSISYRLYQRLWL